MSSGYLRVAVACAVIALASTAEARELKVCADPNNLPFSNARGEGFENKIVALIARDLHASVHYTWWAQRRGFVRNTLKAGLCDLIPGVPANMEMVRTTAPYYRSTYVFVTRADEPAIASFDDPRLKTLRVGVQMIGNDATNSPPAHALAHRGIIKNVRGFTVYGDYAKANPPAAIIAAVAAHKVDVAIAWGPMAGYFAKQYRGLRLAPVTPAFDGPQLPMVFDISMGVRKEDTALRNQVDDILARRHKEIDAILARYGVPRLDVPQPQAMGRT